MLALSGPHAGAALLFFRFDAPESDTSISPTASGHAEYLVVTSCLRFRSLAMVINRRLPFHTTLAAPAIAFCLVLAVGPVVAQSPGDSTPPSTSSPPKINANEPARESTGPGEDLLIRDSQGNLILLQRDADREAILKWLNSGRVPLSDPKYDITSLTLTGTADDQRAQLKAQLKVQLHVEKEWVSVPIGMEEATVDGTSYKGPGQSSLDRTSERERRWWFRGQGLHELSLSLIVPVRTVSPLRRLQLGIPSTASSRLDLTVGLNRILVTPPEGSWMETRTTDKNVTLIQVIGLKDRLNLQWKPTADLAQIETLLQTETRGTLDLTTDPSVLRVEQTVKALQGSFEEFDVQLPRGSVLKKVEESGMNGGRRYQEHRPVPAMPERIHVKLNEPVSDSVTLIWTLETNVSTQGEPFQIHPLTVVNSAVQTGEIEILALKGFRFREIERKNVRRVTRPILQRQVKGVYRFGEPNFTLILDVEEVAPSFRAESFLFVTGSSDSLALDGAIRYRMLQGAVDTVTVDWPGLKSEAWDVIPVDAPDSVPIDFLAKGDAGDFLRMQLAQRQTDDFTVRFRATRTVAADAPFVVNLPRLRSQDRQSTRLLIGHSENVSANLEPVGETIMIPMAPNRIGETTQMFPPHLYPTRPAGFHINSLDHQFTGRIEIEPQTIEIAARVNVDRTRQLVTHILKYDVEHEPLDEVRILVPTFLAGTDVSQSLVTVANQDGTLLMREGAGLIDGQSTRLRYRLPKPQLHTFEIVVQHRLDLPRFQTEAGQTQLPVIQSADAEINSLEFSLTADANTQVAFAESDWRSIATDAGSLLWQSNNAKQDITYTLSETQRLPSQSYSIRKALFRTQFDANGFPRSRAQYQIAASDQSLTLMFPESIRPDAFWWDRQKLTADQIRQQGSTWSLSIDSDSTAGPHILTVDFHGLNPSTFDWTAQHKLDWPLFPKGVWIEQSVWQITLPLNQHLLTIPAGYTRHFQWERSGMVWRRNPGSSAAELNRWLDSSKGPETPEVLASGNTYQFTRFGPSAELTFRSMKWWTLMFAGAGATWMIGLVLVKVRFTRNLLTVPVIIIAVTSIALWYPGPVELFLQPSLLGIALALVMAWIETRINRRSSDRVPGGSSDHYPMPLPASDSELAVALGVNTDGSTEVRIQNRAEAPDLEHSA